MDPIPLFFFLVFLPPFVFFIRRADWGAHLPLRPIPAFDLVKRMLAQGAESGQAVHISVGVAGVGSANTAETAAGLQMLEYLADRTAITATPAIVTVADPTALPLVQDQLRRAYVRQGYPEEHDPARARFIAPNIGGSAVPYAVGALEILRHENVYANVMVGSFGPEFLLMSEPAAEKHAVQVGGATAPAVLPLVYLTMDQPLLGEDIFSAGAYLTHKPAHIGSLLAQDAVRAIVVIAALVLVLVGLLLGAP